jgi:hypothetical protein
MIASSSRSSFLLSTDGRACCRHGPSEERRRGHLGGLADRLPRGLRGARARIHLSAAGGPGDVEGEQTARASVYLQLRPQQYGGRFGIHEDDLPSTSQGAATTEWGSRAQRCRYQDQQERCGSTTDPAEKGALSGKVVCIWCENDVDSTNPPDCMRWFDKDTIQLDIISASMFTFSSVLLGKSILSNLKGVMTLAGFPSHHPSTAQAETKLLWR